jgi:cytochrome oxidase Cu insertion factor (SCO1/SenC/PrrC family)
MQWTRGRKILLLLGLIAVNAGALFAAGNLPLGGGQAVRAPMLERTAADRAVVYFGFPECSTACPVTLGRLSEAYPALRELAGGLGVFFVNLEPDARAEPTRSYTHAFHPDFHAVTPSDDQRARLSRTFGAWLYQTGPDREPFHNPYLYLLVRSEGGWRIHERVPADGDGVPTIRQALQELSGSV